METADSARRLAAVDETAAGLGAAPGQTVADAIALNPGLVILEAEPAADLAALEALADWCLRFSPLVAVDPPDGLFLDIAGCAHLWGGEDALARKLIARLAAQGIPARVGIADAFGAAWALARFGSEPVVIDPSTDEEVEEAHAFQGVESSRHPGRRRGSAADPGPVQQSEQTASLMEAFHPARRTGPGSTLRVVRDDVNFPAKSKKIESSSPHKGGGSHNLASLPVSALRLDPELADRLRRLGLKTIGDAAKLPRSALTRRFGGQLALRLAQAFGQADETLVFRHPADAWIERRVFAEAIDTPDDMARSVSDLAQRLCARLDAHGLGARRFTATFHRVDGAAAHREVTAALPAREPKSLAKLFAGKLETLDPGFGVEGVTLEASAVEPLRVAQTDLVDAAADARDADLAPLIDRLRNSLGQDRVWRAAPVQSHVPERAVGKVEALAPRNETGWDPDKPRPIRLLGRPEPIEAIAPVPDDPPALIRWRGRLHRIVRAEGPERIAAEWWRAPWAEMQGRGSVDRVRDYYRVEDETGARFWVFRTGLYHGERGARWWLHGLFA